MCTIKGGKFFIVLVKDILGRENTDEIMTRKMLSVYHVLGRTLCKSEETLCSVRYRILS